MDILRKYWFALPVLPLFAAIIWWMTDAGEIPVVPDAPIHTARKPLPFAHSTAQPQATDEEAAKETIERIETPSAPEIPHVERLKELDRTHLKTIHKGLFEYKKVHGHFPEYLSQLVPQFIAEDALDSVRKTKDGLNDILARDHVDPGKENPSYGFEFSNLIFRDGRTFADIKEVQRAEWGDAIPILRAFGYDKVINMSYGGDIYETKLNWEWDPATLDVVSARGWGPGLAAGQFTEVRVLGANGQPMPNTSVWADGRNYSFALPERPYTTDANGIARIPLGTDLDRTDLVLRVEGNGIASQAVDFPKGQPPANYDLTTAPAQTVGGQLLDAKGAPVGETWVYLKSAIEGQPSTSLGVVKTDANGQWLANLHPADAAAFGLAIGTGNKPPQNLKAQPVDPTTAGTRTAITTLPGKSTK